MAKRQKTLLCVDDNQTCLNICKIILEDLVHSLNRQQQPGRAQSSCV